MLNVYNQKLILSTPFWKQYFSLEEYEYIKNVVNGLIKYSDGMVAEVSFQVSTKGNIRAFHIFEPFITLNSMDYSCPSVVSIIFNDKNEISFMVGDDNGMEVFSDGLKYIQGHEYNFSSGAEMDFRHFISFIGEKYQNI